MSERLVRHLSGVEAMTMSARLAAVALVHEVELTCRWLDGLAVIPEGERPTPEQVADLVRVIEHRGQAFEREQRALSGALQGAMSATLLLAERRAGG